MHIDEIGDLTTFTQLKDNWNALYDADPDAQFFLSWRWLSTWLTQPYGAWVILGAKMNDHPDAPYVGFFPLRLVAKVSESGDVRNEVYMVGNFAADYTGLICLPKDEKQIIAAFARHLKTMRWSQLNLEGMRMSDSRLRVLLSYFSKAGFQTERIDRVNAVDGTDNSICPFAALPRDWDTYLAGRSANTRQKLRRLLRLLTSDDGYRITDTTPEAFEQDIERLLSFWETKWRARKGAAIQELVKKNRSMLTRCFQAGTLFLPTLWHADRPLAASAILIDERKKSLLFYMAGRDQSFGDFPSGLLLHAYCIRYAIDNSFSEYDFLRGNEPYKSSFATEERRIHAITVKTRNGINIGRYLDGRTIPEAIDRTTTMHRAGKFDAAERAYRQILETDGTNEDALHRLGQLLISKGHNIAAAATFEKLTALRPNLVKPWLCLAQSYERLQRDADAGSAYRQALRLRPEAPEAFAGLTRLLIRAGRLKEVNAALLAAFCRSDETLPNTPIPPVQNGHVVSGGIA